MKYLYIKNDVRGKYVDFDEMLDPELYDNIGTTYKEYLRNKWVLLNDEQIKFKKANPKATVYEVFNMKLNGNVEE